MRSLSVLRAMEAVPRASFVEPAHLALAARDVALPIDGGQSVSSPLFVARMLQGARIENHMRILEIGAGSGYTTALLAHLCREVVAVERSLPLAARAQARLGAFGLSHVSIAWRDGLAVAEDACGRFDLVVIEAAVAEVPASVWALLEPSGAIVHATATPVRMLVRSTRDARSAICPARLQTLQTGLAKFC